MGSRGVNIRQDGADMQLSLLVKCLGFIKGAAASQHENVVYDTNGIE